MTVRLFRREWRPDASASAAVVLVHGFGEHSGRYENVGPALSARGIAVHAYDQRGHGRSAGRRGHIDAWADYHGDLEDTVGRIRAADATGTPVFLYGHSMGGLVVLEYALRKPERLAGLIVSAAPLRPGNVAGPLKVAMARVLSRLVPGFSLDLGLEAADLSRDTAHIHYF